MLTIYPHEIPTLEAKIAQLNKRAKKLGLAVEPISAEYGPERVVKMQTKWGEVEVVVQTVTIRGEAPRVNGWTFVARVEHTEAGNLVVGTGAEGEDLSPYYTVDPTCDHCHTNRNRRDTFVLSDESGTIIRIGRSCLADFVRSADAEEFARWAIRGDLYRSEFDEDEASGSFSHGKRHLSPLDFVARSVAAIRVDGRFVPSRQDGSTVEAVRFALTPPRDLSGVKEWESRQPTLADVQTAKAAIAWLATQPQSDYIHNLTVAANMFGVTPRTEGILASLPQAYRKAIGEQGSGKAPAQKCPVPAEIVGKRVQLTGIAISYKFQENAFGGGSPKALLRFTTPNGEWRGWVTASCPAGEHGQKSLGDEWTFTATVKPSDSDPCFAILSRPTKVSVKWANPHVVPPESTDVIDHFAGFGEETAA